MAKTGGRSRAGNRKRKDDECWAGERWLQGKATAMKFRSEEEAQRFIDGSWERLQKAP